MSRLAVVGSGVGGLAAAAILAHEGHDVTVFEAGPIPGGKAGQQVVDGVGFDTGPSVLTLPEVFRTLFARCGEQLADTVTLRTLDPAFRYLWTDGTTLDVRHAPEDTLAEVRQTLGPEAAEELGAFLDYARRIWDTASPRFVFGPALEARTLLTVPPSELLGLTRVDPLRTMRGGIARHVRSPHLRWLLERYATYNGSDPRAAPATLNCIAHVELGLGGYGVEGGIHALVQALVGLLERQGGTLRLATPVERITLTGGRVTGIVTAEGPSSFDGVVCNADVGHLAHTLLPEASPPAPSPASTSGWTAVVRASTPPVAAHAVAWPEAYGREFEDLFDHDRPPQDPTVYACDQTLAHGRPTWSDGSRPVFLMANAPAEPTGGSRPDATWSDLRERVLARARAAGLIGPDDPVVWERSPAGLAASFPGSRGALYGAASNSPLSAFKRPANRIRRVPGLYLASGSAHPGGGLPLVAMSGQLAADAVLADLS